MKELFEKVNFAKNHQSNKKIMKNTQMPPTTLATITNLEISLQFDKINFGGQNSPKYHFSISKLY